MRKLSLRKCKHLLRQIVKRYRRKERDLSLTTREEIKEQIFNCQNEILKKDKEKSRLSFHSLNLLAKAHLSKTPFEKVRDFIWGLFVALLIAFLIRQVWFELYRVPTGSMRPTIREKDTLIVSKTTFGINIPFTTKHLYFDPNLALRAHTFVFTVRDMDVQDPDQIYFWIFPGKKQFVKRMMGKPSDTLYFYGGKVYGIDSDGRDITKELEPSTLEKIDHIPFIRFEGQAKTGKKVDHGLYRSTMLYQMNEPVARLSLTPSNQIQGEILSQKKIKDYQDLWGFKNYGIALLEKAEGENAANLKIIHDPNFGNASLKKDLYGRLRPALGTYTSTLPLTLNDLKTLQKNLYTARFIVKEGYAYRYGDSKQTPSSYTPKLPGVPDGTYEYYYGVPKKILLEGITLSLPKDHPLNQFNVDRLFTLYNYGIEFDKRYGLESHYDSLLPSRYTYFREGDLYVMGGKLLDKSSPALQQFVSNETMLASTTTTYLPFIDHGAPVKNDGTIDKEYLKRYGLTLPSKHYLALGDNYAMSSDSRDFGFVPEGNLRGAPDFIFWPPGSGFGDPNAPPYPFFNFPRTIIWGLAAIAYLLWYLHHRKYYKLPMKLP
ncbi:MAG: signal peptidase I [Simkaniaceae bacterium]